MSTTKKGAKQKARRLYMHTLDGKPATFDNDPRFGPCLYFAGGRNAVKLVPSLRQIRREQAAALAQADADVARGMPVEWTDRDKYGYVIVEVSRV